MQIKKIVLIIVLIIALIYIGCTLFKTENKNNYDSNKMQIITSNFASYDFVRAIIGDNEKIEIKLLLGPGKDIHSYEPTAKDIIAMQKADLFIYIGGESEKWAEKVLSTLEDTSVKIICIADLVETIKEKEIDGAENEEEEDNAFDEHIWTSPKNAIQMINILENEIEKIDNENAKNYQENAKQYIKQIENVDSKIQEIVNNRVRDRLIFADKMPMQYFIDYYNLKVSAAFTGCSTETEASPSTISYLIDKAKEEHIPVILYIELNNGRVANIIADEVGNKCKAMQIQTLHNVSLEDFNNKETWVSLMTRNISVLQSALQ